MGKNNKQRRAAKKRKRQSGRTGPPRASQSRGYEPPTLDEVLHTAVFADPLAAADLERIMPLLLAYAEALPAAVDRWLAELLDTLWSTGWTPADVVRVVEREVGEEHAELAALAVLDDGRRRLAAGQRLHVRWEHQLEALRERHGRMLRVPRATFARTSLELLRLLARLTPILSTLPQPGSEAAAVGTERGLDERILAKVRALLVKAESTTFEQEAEALSAKAQELIARYAIDEAILHEGEDVGAPAIRRIPVDDPYADAKASLLTEIAEANRCRVVFNASLACVTAFGYDADLDAVELLAASLLAQATGAMARQGSQRDAAGRSRTRSFRRAFLYGFAARIGQRLRAATDGQVAEADDRLLPVLAARSDRLDDAVAAAFPQLDHRSTSIGNGAGYAAGHVAANHADLGVSAERLQAS